VRLSLSMSAHPFPMMVEGHPADAGRFLERIGAATDA
jgi:hypothetical protein